MGPIILYIGVTRGLIVKTLPSSTLARVTHKQSCSVYLHTQILHRSLYIIINDGIDHPGATSRSAELRSTHSKRENLFNAITFKGTPGNIRIRSDMNGR